MKKFTKTALWLVLTIAFATPAFAQNNEKKTEQFGKIAKLSQTKKPEDQEKAYKMGKEFLAQYGTDDDDQVKKIKDFVGKYRVTDFNKKLDDLKVAEAFEVGKEILAQEPDNTYVVINMAYGGYDLFQKKQDKSLSADSLNYARQALGMMEAGKTPASFDPFKTQAEATAIMHYVVGTFTFETAPNEAAQHFYKALQYESQIKNTSYPYYAIAFGYEKEYEKAAKAYQAKVVNKAPESELLAEQDKLGKIVDRMLDAYARAVKHAETDNNPGKADWKKRFMEIYKHKNQSEAGLDEYINATAGKPLPDPNTL